MNFAYMLENNNQTYKIDNQPLMAEIVRNDIPEEKIYIDAVGDGNRPEFNLLLNDIRDGDILYIRSIGDLSDATGTILYILGSLGEMGVVVRSVCEPQYNYDNLIVFGYGVKVVKELSEKKRKLGILQATSAGKMGRKIDEDTKDMVVRLKMSGFKVEEIINLCDISRSTYYRYVKNADYFNLIYLLPLNSGIRKLRWQKSANI